MSLRLALLTNMSDTRATGIEIVGDNAEVAARLEEFAELLDAQGADDFRARAFRNAAREIEVLPQSVIDLFREGGVNALVRLRGIGHGIAAAIAEMATTGRWGQLDRLKGELTAEAVFRTIPGTGPELARRLADTLEVETLEELETALRLGGAHVAGIGPRRREAILAALGARLIRMRQAIPSADPPPEPPVSVLLDTDTLYRTKAEAGALRQIAPKRFNPTGEAWLPIMHSRRGNWHLTALYSNTARAHELHRTRDWVVIHFHERDGPESRRTIVTERIGPLTGRRVVRGREGECREYYEHLLRGDSAALTSGITPAS